MYLPGLFEVGQIPSQDTGRVGKLTHHSAFNAIISSSVVMLDISYGIPIAVNCLRGRNMLPERPFVLPNALGWILNMVSRTRTYSRVDMWNNMARGS